MAASTLSVAACRNVLLGDMASIDSPLDCLWDGNLKIQIEAVVRPLL
jgi:hypothetical protein